MAAASSKIIAVRCCLNWSPLSPSLFRPLSPSPFLLRRGGHWSAYEKNEEEQICPTVVPDHVIHSLSENYWSPHPQTGVFGPPTTLTLHTDTTPTVSAPKTDTSASAAGAPEEGSVLELKAWFRHNGLEDPEKPHFL